MFVGDREAIPRYDRVPEVSQLRQRFSGEIVDGRMPSFIEGLYVEQWRERTHKKMDKDYQRSVYSANGILHISDPELGVIKIDQYGDVM